MNKKLFYKELLLHVQRLQQILTDSKKIYAGTGSEWSDGRVSGIEDGLGTIIEIITSALINGLISEKNYSSFLEEINLTAPSGEQEKVS